MKAAVVREVGAPVSIEEVEVSAVRADEVRVATRAVGLCHSDLHVIDGHIDRPLPHLLGHEAAGVVVEVGSAVTSVGVGDHVVACLVVSCGTCRQCAAGHRALCSNKGVCNRAADDEPRYRDGDGVAVTQFSNVGALVEEMLVHHSAVTPIPAGVPFEAAALLGCAVVTGVGSVENVAEVQPGQSVVVVGCGGVGLNILWAARAAGAGLVVAVDLDEERRRTAVDHFGATDAVDGADGERLAERVLELTGGVDHAFDAVGSPAITRRCLEMTVSGGTTYAVGIFGSGTELVVPTGELLRGKRLIPIRMGDVDPAVDIPKLADRYLTGELPLDRLITDRIPIDETNAGFDRLRAVDGTRTVVVFPTD